MRILVFSDSHGDLSVLDEAISHYKPERIFGLGDYDVSEYELLDRNVIGVKGNSYYDPDHYLVDRICEIKGFKFLFTHGHTHSVRGSLISLKMFALENKIDIGFFGHTHIASISDLGNLTLVNPGSIGRPYSPQYPTLVIMDLDDEKAIIDIVDPIMHESVANITVDKRK